MCLFGKLANEMLSEPLERAWLFVIPQARYPGSPQPTDDVVQGAHSRIEGLDILAALSELCV